MLPTRDLEDLLVNPLPSPWSFAVTDDGRVFFINEEERRTTWIHPVLRKSLQTGHLHNISLPLGWEMNFTPDGRPYYIDHNGEWTTFQPPGTESNSLERARSQPIISSVTNQSQEYEEGQDDKGRLSREKSRSSFFRRSNSKRRSSKRKIDKSPAVRRDQEAPVSLKGWLYKQEGIGPLKSWRKRWFVLADFCLFFYKSPEEENNIGSLLLPSYRINKCEGSDPSFSKKFSFKAQHENMKTVYLAAETSEEREAWIEALRMATMLQHLPSIDAMNKSYLTGRSKSDNNLAGRQPPSYSESDPQTPGPNGEGQNFEENLTREGDRRASMPSQLNRHSSIEQSKDNDPNLIQGQSTEINRKWDSKHSHSHSFDRDSWGNELEQPGVQHEAQNQLHDQTSWKRLPELDQEPHLHGGDLSRGDYERGKGKSKHNQRGEGQYNKEDNFANPAPKIEKRSTRRGGDRKSKEINDIEIDPNDFNPNGFHATDFDLGAKAKYADEQISEKPIPRLIPVEDMNRNRMFDHSMHKEDFERVEYNDEFNMLHGQTNKYENDKKFERLDSAHSGRSKKENELYRDDQYSGRSKKENELYRDDQFSGAIKILPHTSSPEAPPPGPLSLTKKPKHDETDSSINSLFLEQTALDEKLRKKSSKKSKNKKPQVEAIPPSLEKDIVRGNAYEDVDILQNNAKLPDGVKYAEPLSIKSLKENSGSRKSDNAKPVIRNEKEFGEKIDLGWEMDRENDTLRRVAEWTQQQQLLHSMQPDYATDDADQIPSVDSNRLNIDRIQGDKSPPMSPTSESSDKKSGRLLHPVPKPPRLGASPLPSRAYPGLDVSKIMGKSYPDAESTPTKLNQHIEGIDPILDMGSLRSSQMSQPNKSYGSNVEDDEKIRGQTHQSGISNFFNENTRMNYDIGQNNDFMYSNKGNEMKGNIEPPPGVQESVKGSAASQFMGFYQNEANEPKVQHFQQNVEREKIVRTPDSLAVEGFRADSSTKQSVKFTSEEALNNHVRTREDITQKWLRATTQKELIELLIQLKRSQVRLEEVRYHLLSSLDEDKNVTDTKSSVNELKNILQEIEKQLNLTRPVIESLDKDVIKMSASLKPFDSEKSTKIPDGKEMTRPDHSRDGHNFRSTPDMSHQTVNTPSFPSQTIESLRMEPISLPDRNTLHDFPRQEVQNKSNVTNPPIGYSHESNKPNIEGNRMEINQNENPDYSGYNRMAPDSNIKQDDQMDEKLRVNPGVPPVRNDTHPLCSTLGQNVFPRQRDHENINLEKLPMNETLHIDKRKLEDPHIDKRQIEEKKLSRADIPLNQLANQEKLQQGQRIAGELRNVFTQDQNVKKDPILSKHPNAVQLPFGKIIGETPGQRYDVKKSFDAKPAVTQGYTEPVLEVLGEKLNGVYNTQTVVREINFKLQSLREEQAKLDNSMLRLKAEEEIEKDPYRLTQKTQQKNTLDKQLYALHKQIDATNKELEAAKRTYNKFETDATDIRRAVYDKSSDPKVQQLQGHGQQQQGHMQHPQGQVQQLQGHGQQLQGHTQQLQGPGQHLQGHGQQLQGQVQQLQGHTQQLQGHGQQLQGHGHQLQGHGQQPHGQPQQPQGHLSQSQGRNQMTEPQIPPRMPIPEAENNTVPSRLDPSGANVRNDPVLNQSKDARSGQAFPKQDQNLNSVETGRGGSYQNDFPGTYFETDLDTNVSRHMALRNRSRSDDKRDGSGVSVVRQEPSKEKENREPYPGYDQSIRKRAPPGETHQGQQEMRDQYQGQSNQWSQGPENFRGPYGNQQDINRNQYSNQQDSNRGQYSNQQDNLRGQYSNQQDYQRMQKQMPEREKQSYPIPPKNQLVSSVSNPNFEDKNQKPRDFPNDISRNDYSDSRFQKTDERSHIPTNQNAGSNFGTLRQNTESSYKSNNSDQYSDGSRNKAKNDYNESLNRQNNELSRQNNTQRDNFAMYNDSKNKSSQLPIDPRNQPNNFQQNPSMQNPSMQNFQQHSNILPNMQQEQKQDVQQQQDLAYKQQQQRLQSLQRQYQQKSELPHQKLQAQHQQFQNPNWQQQQQQQQQQQGQQQHQYPNQESLKYQNTMNLNSSSRSKPEMPLTVDVQENRRRIEQTISYPVSPADERVVGRNTQFYKDSGARVQRAQSTERVTQNQPGGAFNTGINYQNQSQPYNRGGRQEDNERYNQKVIPTDYSGMLREQNYKPYQTGVNIAENLNNNNDTRINPELPYDSRTPGYPNWKDPQQKYDSPSSHHRFQNQNSLDLISNPSSDASRNQNRNQYNDPYGNRSAPQTPSDSYGTRSTPQTPSVEKNWQPANRTVSHPRNERYNQEFVKTAAHGYNPSEMSPQSVPSHSPYQAAHSTPRRLDDMQNESSNIIQRHAQSPGKDDQQPQRNQNISVRRMSGLYTPKPFKSQPSTNFSIKSPSDTETVQSLESSLREDSYNIGGHVPLITNQSSASERYGITPEEINKQDTSERLRRMVAAQSLQEFSRGELTSQRGELRHQVADEKRRREQMLDIRHALAQESALFLIYKSLLRSMLIFRTN